MLEFLKKVLKRIIEGQKTPLYKIMKNGDGEYGIMKNHARVLEGWQHEYYELVPGEIYTELDAAQAKMDDMITEEEAQLKKTTWKEI